MRRIIKELSSFAVIVLLMVFSVSTADSMSFSTFARSVADTSSLQIGDLSFSNLFKKNDSQFGLISNSSSEPVNYTGHIYYGTGHEKNEMTSSEYHSYVINKYDVNISVNEDNTFDVTETITAHFIKPHCGLVREIPLKNKIVKPDGTASNESIKISNVSVDNKYTTTQSENKLKIKIGDVKSIVTGDQTYVLQYKCVIEADKVNTYARLYYNIIGDEWDTTISNITFKITMPKEFDTSKLEFYSGTRGSIDSSKVKYNVNGNTITGSYDKVLYKNQALTVKCELPKGYFVRKPFEIDPLLVNLMLIVPILGFLITLFFWFEFSRGRGAVETVEFYPPKGLNSLDVGFLYRGQAIGKDVVSLLIYLANKGYIKICETENNGLFSRAKNIKIEKLKKYDGDNENERMFLEGLFAIGHSVSLSDVRKFRKKEERKGRTVSYLSAYKHEKAGLKSSNKPFVTLKDLQFRFYVTVNRILSNINKTNKNKIIEKSSLVRSVVVCFLVFISMATIFIIPSIGYTDYYNALVLHIMCHVVVIFLLVIIFTVCICGFKALSCPFTFKIVLLGIILLCLFGFSWISAKFLPTIAAISNNTTYRLGFIIGMLCVIGMIVLLVKIPQRTEYGNEMLGKIKGFRRFLKTVEKEKLETMIVQDPTYFYDILPYAYALDVSDKWFEKFESILLHAPAWYVGPNVANTYLLRENMRFIMRSTQRSMLTKKDRSGHSLGRGFAGGGFGGGGGSAW